MDESIAMEGDDNFVPARSRILVQSDWESGDKSWVMVKTPGQTSLRGTFTDNNNTCTLPEGFTVEKPRRTILSVSHARAGYTALFVAPSSVWPHIHDKGAIGIDVTEGGLGVSTTTSGDMKVWTTNNGEVRRHLEGHINAVYSCKFFPSGTVILSGGADMRVKVWSAETGQCPVTLVGHHGGINDVAIIDRGRNVVTVSLDGRAKLWDVGQATCLHSFDDLGAGVINGCSLGTVDMRSKGNGMFHAVDGEREIGTEGKFAILGCDGDKVHGKLVGLSLKSRETIFNAPTPSPVNTCLMLSDHMVAYGMQDGSIGVCDIRNMDKPVMMENESRGAVLDLKRFRNGFLTSTQDGSVYYVPEKNFLSAAGRNQIVLELTGPECDPVYRVAPQGQNVVFTACRDGNIRKYLIEEELLTNIES